MTLSVQQYLQADATALADLVQRGEVSAAELLALATAQLQRLNPQLNAVNRPMPEQARQRVGETLEGPLAGVPVLIKDAVQDYAGLPTSNGSRAFRHHVAASHSTVVQRLLDAGAVIIGKTNTPELALKGFTDPQAFGITRNPWDLTRTPGGSSGGSAAAVAAGIVPMAGANDGGGSIRIPAACCGLLGLRPSRGRVPCGPASGEIWEGASSDLVVSRSVRDSALALDVLAGPACGEPFVIAPPAQSFRALLSEEPRRLRIAFSTRSPLDTEVHPEAIAAVQHTVRLLEKLGHEVIEAEPRYDGHALARCYLDMYFGQVAATLAEAREAGARSADFELATRLLEAFGTPAVALSRLLVAQPRQVLYIAQADHSRRKVIAAPMNSPSPADGGKPAAAWNADVWAPLMLTASALRAGCNPQIGRKGHAVGRGWASCSPAGLGGCAADQRPGASSRSRSAVRAHRHPGHCGGRCPRGR